MLETDGVLAPQIAYTLAGTRLISQAQIGNTSYYLADALGSTRALTDGVGTVSDTYRYAAFGELVDSNGVTSNKYLFTGQQFDALTGQYSLRARYYAPTSGRFLSRDTWPINIQDPIELNRYVYAANDPISLADPSGYTSVETAKLKQSVPTVSHGAVDAMGFITASTLIFVLILLVATFPPELLPQGAKDVSIPCAGNKCKEATVGFLNQLADIVEALGSSIQKWKEETSVIVWAFLLDTPWKFRRSSNDFHLFVSIQTPVGGAIVDNFPMWLVDPTSPTRTIANPPIQIGRSADALVALYRTNFEPALASACFEVEMSATGLRNAAKSAEQVMSDMLFKDAYRGGSPQCRHN